MSRLIFCDVETGGLNPETDALLSVALVDWRDGVLGDHLSVLVHPENLRVDAQALTVNKINLARHIQYAASRSDAREKIILWLLDHKGSLDRVRLAGHNVDFDLGFLLLLLRSKSGLLHRRPICTMSMLPLFFHSGIIPDIGRLDDALKAFGVTRDGEAHTALSDAISAAKLYNAMLARLRGDVRC